MFQKLLLFYKIIYSSSRSTPMISLSWSSTNTSVLIRWVMIPKKFKNARNIILKKIYAHFWSGLCWNQSLPLVCQGVTTLPEHLSFVVDKLLSLNIISMSEFVTASMAEIFFVCRPFRLGVCLISMVLGKLSPWKCGAQFDGPSLPGPNLLQHIRPRQIGSLTMWDPCKLGPGKWGTKFGWNHFETALWAKLNVKLEIDKCLPRPSF